MGHAAPLPVPRAAVRARHDSYLPGILEQHRCRHCCGAVRPRILAALAATPRCPLDPHATLVAAGEHCDLAGLQRAWEELGGDPFLKWDRDKEVASAAGRSEVAPIAKLSWLLTKAGGAAESQQMLLSAAAGAASSGSLAVLHWLLEQGLDLISEPEPVQRWLTGDPFWPWCKVLTAALKRGHVAVADWLVDEAGCRLPKEQERLTLLRVWRGAVEDPSGAAVRWLRGRGVHVHAQAATFAGLTGQLGAIQYLHVECGLPLTPTVAEYAAASGCVATAKGLLQAECTMSPLAYSNAARKGGVDMIRWLATEAKCPWAEDTITSVMRHWPSGQGSSESLEQAVRLLVEAGCPHRLECCRLASRSLPLLRYLREELGVGFGPDTLAAAAAGGCEAVLEWLVGAGCVGGGGEYMGPYTQAAI